jgi:hypothetical protein
MYLCTPLKVKECIGGKYRLYFFHWCRVNKATNTAVSSVYCLLHSGILSCLLLNPEDVSDTFLRNIVDFRGPHGVIRKKTEFLNSIEDFVLIYILPCTPFKVKRRFGRTCRLHLHGRKISSKVWLLHVSCSSLSSLILRATWSYKQTKRQMPGP